MNLYELFSYGDLQAEIAAGYVSRRFHDDDPDLFILNYTKKAQAEGRWNDVTRQCRGLIAKWVVGEVEPQVIARPFHKFFNYQEHPAGTFNLDETVIATDKADGSLGILYPHPNGGWAIATRGSFHSEQAVKGTEILQRYIKEGFEPNPSRTYLFEIIYPENRIVLNYGEVEELRLLNASPIHLASTLYFGLPEIRFFSIPEAEVTTLRELLEAAPRPNAEGWVLHFPDRMVKLKQEDYVRLHRIVTGLNELAVWEMYREDRYSYFERLAEIPEEFHDWFRGVWEAFYNAAGVIEDAVWDAWYDIANQLWPSSITPDPHELTREDRKRFADLAKDTPYPSMLFLLLDEKFDGLHDAAIKMVRPSGKTASPLRQSDMELAA